MSKKNKAAKAAKAQDEKDAPKQKVVMVFSEDKFYNDLSKPIYEKGKEYEIGGVDMVQRWLKRGGKIIEGKLEIKRVEPNLSSIVKKPDAENKSAEKEAVVPGSEGIEQESADEGEDLKNLSGDEDISE